jgi:hypothetical protein
VVGSPDGQIKLRGKLAPEVTGKDGETNGPDADRLSLVSVLSASLYEKITPSLVV